MRVSFMSILRNRDSYGHPIGVFYKGDDAYQTLLGGVMTLTAQILTFVLLTQAIQEIIQMEEPAVNTYETFIDVEARDEIGAVNLEEKGTVIAFRASGWHAYNGSSKVDTSNWSDQIASQYGRVAAFSNKNGHRKELKLVDCRTVLT